jgi:putative oxidoreductase
MLATPWETETMPPTILAKFSAETYAALRIVTGLLFSMHGTQKLFGFPGGEPVDLMTRMGAAGVIELVCGILIALGLFTSYAAFLASGQMAFAYFLAHAPRGPWPLQNEGELAVVYCFLFLYMAAAGSGVWSVDNTLRR